MFRLLYSFVSTLGDTLMSSSERDINLRLPECNGRTALMRACLDILDKEMEELLRLGADPNIQDYDGNTALHFADSDYKIQMLIEAGAKLNTKNNDGNTPLAEHTARNNHRAVVVLLEAGAK